MTGISEKYLCMQVPHLVRMRLSVERCHVRHILLECPQPSTVLLLCLVLLVVHTSEDAEGLLGILLEEDSKPPTSSIATFQYTVDAAPRFSAHLSSLKCQAMNGVHIQPLGEGPDGALHASKDKQSCHKHA